MNSTEKEIIEIARANRLQVEFCEGAIQVSAPAQLYQKESELMLQHCGDDSLCQPMAYFEMIECCGICGKVT